MNSKQRLKLDALKEMIQKDSDIEEVFQQQNMVSDIIASLGSILDDWN